jgi:hypothetical protein
VCLGSITIVLLRNDAGQGRAWIGFELEGTKSNRDAIGAKIIIEAGKRKLVRWITGGASYLSSHDKRVIVGLGDDAAGTQVNAEIRWPSGRVQHLTKLKQRQYHKIREPAESATLPEKQEQNLAHLTSTVFQ